MSFSTGKSRISRRRFAQVSAGVAGAAIAAPAAVGARSRRYHPAMLQTDPVAGKVLMWAYPLVGGGDQAANEELWASVASSFNAEFPDVEVQVEVQPWTQRNEKLTTALAANAGPDVGYLNDDFIPQHGGDGNLQPLDDVLGVDAADFTESSLASMSVDGTLYALPILGSVTTMVYNLNIFNELGISEFPGTWDELLELGPTIRDAGYKLTSYAGSLESSLNHSYFPHLWQADGDVLNEDMTASAFNSEAGIEALEFVKTLYQEEFIDQGEAVTPPPPGGGLVMEGQVAVNMYADNNGTRQYVEAWGGEDTVRIGPPLEHKVQTSYGTSAGFGVFKNAQDPDAAKAWVKYITGPEAMPEIIGPGGYMSPRASLVGLHEGDPILGEFEKYVDQMHGGVRHRLARQIISTMAPYLQAAFIGDQSVEDALATAADDVDRLLERG